MSDSEPLVDLIDRQTVFDALTKVFDTFEHNVTTKLQYRGKGQHVILDRENKMLEAQVLQLQQETSSLKGQLQELSAATREHESHNYERLEEQCLLLREANKLLKKETRQARRNEATWVKYAEVLEKELGIDNDMDQILARFAIAKQAKEKVQVNTGESHMSVIEPDLPTATLPEAPSEATVAGTSALPSFDSGDKNNIPEAPTGEALALEPVEDVEPHLLATRQPCPKSEAPTEEGTDQDEDLPAQLTDQTRGSQFGTIIKPEPSSDPPVFLSTRPVKKRRLLGNDLDTIATPVSRAVKEEITHEDMQEDQAAYLRALARFQESPPESSDLDDGSTEMPTPKKCRSSKPDEDMQLPRYPVLATPERPDALSSPKSRRNPRQQGVVTSSVFVGGAGLTADYADEKRESSPFALQPLGALLDTPAEQRVKVNPLSPKPGFARRTYLEGRGTSAKETSRAGKRKAREGETEAVSTPKPGPRLLAPSAHTPKQPLSPKVMTPSTVVNKAVATGRKPLMDRAPNAQIRKMASPLRCLPIESLMPTDFRINPATNDHKDFAFDEVVRHKDDRAKMTGCTDPRCPRTKDLHAMVIAEAAHLTKNHGEKFYHTPDHITLVEKYLGDDAGRIPQMNVSQRRTLWMQARLQQQANIYGRCRHRLDRAQTPEQYWDTGFPNTQEQEKDREEGRRMDRWMVEVRRREAMKIGGRWLFRDEFLPEALKNHRV